MRGFSLIELSIVLVILGLLTGGILAGQSLIRAAELRAVSTEHARYVTAVQTFRDKYFALPGDFNKAEDFWTTNPNGCPNGGGTVGTCNGSGNGRIGDAFSMTCESQEFFRHLQLAGLIEGSTTVNTAVNCYAKITKGVENPLSKLSSASWMVHYFGNRDEDSNTWPGTAFFEYNYGNVLTLAGGQSTDHLHFADGIMKPEEAWNIDTKIDDGAPQHGFLLVPRRFVNFTGPPNDCVTSVDIAVADYNLTDDSTGACTLIFKLGM